MKKIVLIIAVCLCSCSTDLTVTLEEVPKDTQAFQKLVIGQLSGELPINISQRKAMFLRSRWSTKERKVARFYLKAILENFGMQAHDHSYASGNVNPGVDLLIEPLRGTNLFTILPAIEKTDEYIVLGAHYDTGGKNVPGAIDNGSGIALILSVLKESIKLGTRNKNLLVVFFDQEEEDISAGSLAFAKYMIKNKMTVHSVHSFDLIGWDGDNNKEIELALPNEKIEKIYRKQATKLNIPIYTSTVKSSDHFSFIRHGLPAVCVSQALSKGDSSGKKDTPEDGFQLVNFEFLSSATNLAIAVIKDLLND